MGNRGYISLLQTMLVLDGLTVPRNELKSILKDYHYESDTENMSKDVVVALENLVGDLR